MMNNHSFWNSAMYALPYDQGSFAPFVRFCDFDEGAPASIAPEPPDCDRSDLQPIGGLSSFLKFGGGGQMPASHTGIPRCLSWFKRSRRDVASSMTITQHFPPAMFGQAFLAPASSASSGTTCDDFTMPITDRTYDRHSDAIHWLSPSATIISLLPAKVNGTGTSGLDPQDARVADLFAEREP
jgi:hypothetical protein